MTSTAAPLVDAAPQRQTVTPALGEAVSRLGGWAITGSLAVIFLWYGCMKFVPFEAAGLAGIISNNPLLSWLYAVFGVQGGARFLGCFELLTAALIAGRVVDPRASALGGAMGAWSFVLTVSCMFTTPGVIAMGHEGTLDLSTAPGAFLLKDIVLFSACLWLLGQSLVEMSARRRTR